MLFNTFFWVLQIEDVRKKTSFAVVSHPDSKDAFSLGDTDEIQVATCCTYRETAMAFVYLKSYFCVCVKGLLHDSMVDLETVASSRYLSAFRLRGGQTAEPVYSDAGNNLCALHMWSSDSSADMAALSAFYSSVRLESPSWCWKCKTLYGIRSKFRFELHPVKQHHPLVEGKKQTLIYF